MRPSDITDGIPRNIYALLYQILASMRPSDITDGIIVGRYLTAADCKCASMRPSDITDGIAQQSAWPHSRATEASMRPSDITDGISAPARGTRRRCRFNEAVGYYRRNPRRRLQGPALAGCFNEAVGYYRRNRRHRFT